MAFTEKMEEEKIEEAKEHAQKRAFLRFNTSSYDYNEASDPCNCYTLVWITSELREAFCLEITHRRTVQSGYWQLPLLIS